MLLLLTVVPFTAATQQGFWWNMSAAVASEGLSYNEHVTAFAAQGLFHKYQSDRDTYARLSSQPTSADEFGKWRAIAPRSQTLMMFDIGQQNYDWPQSDAYWHSFLQANDRVNFTELPASLCGLVASVTNIGDAVVGLVVYEGDSQNSSKFFGGDGYSAAIALTIASQQRLLPVAAASLPRHQCLRNMRVVVDLRKVLAGKTRQAAWDWSIENLLPRAATDIVFNLNHYRVSLDPFVDRHDHQSPATASSIDYIIMKNAFVLDLESHAATGHGTAPRNADDSLIERVFSRLDPLFDAYGWAEDEFAWTNETSVFGGTIMCSFASPNLSFWALLKLPEGRTRARPLPLNDRGIALNKSKYYVIFETNEGDTPRILVSAMASAWARPERGSLPVAWAIDPLLAERFPALFDYFAATATANDSFIAGTAGAGYAFLNQMSAQQLQVYGERVGALTAQYGPHVFDTYGYANLSVHEHYERAAREGGAGPTAFVTQANWVNGAIVAPYDPFYCPEDNLVLNTTGTPLICSSGQPRLFYYSDSLNPVCPSCTLAERIRTAATRHPPPFFVLVYGGLQAFGGSEKKSPKNFFTLQADAMRRLGEDFEVIGASEMARLSREALAPTPSHRVD